MDNTHESYENQLDSPGLDSLLIHFERRLSICLSVCLSVYIYIYIYIYTHKYSPRSAWGGRPHRRLFPVRARTLEGFEDKRVVNHSPKSSPHVFAYGSKIYIHNYCFFFNIHACCLHHLYFKQLRSDPQPGQPGAGQACGGCGCGGGGGCCGCRRRRRLRGRRVHAEPSCTQHKLMSCHVTPS